MFDTKEGRSIQARGLVLLKSLEKEFGVTLSSHGFVYGQTLTLKFNVTKPGDSEDDRMQKALPDALSMCGLSPDLAGSRITVNGKEFTLFGYRSTRGSKPFVLQRDGRSYTAGLATIQAAVSGDSMRPVTRVRSHED